MDFNNPMSGVSTYKKWLGILESLAGYAASKAKENLNKSEDKYNQKYALAYKTQGYKVVTYSGSVFPEMNTILKKCGAEGIKVIDGKNGSKTYIYPESYQKNFDRAEAMLNTMCKNFDIQNFDTLQRFAKARESSIKTISGLSDVRLMTIEPLLAMKGIIFCTSSSKDNNSISFIATDEKKVKAVLKEASFFLGASYSKKAQQKFDRQDADIKNIINQITANPEKAIYVSSSEMPDSYLRITGNEYQKLYEKSDGLRITTGGEKGTPSDFKYLNDLISEIIKYKDFQILEEAEINLLKEDRQVLMEGREQTDEFQLTPRQTIEQDFIDFNSSLSVYHININGINSLKSVAQTIKENNQIEPDEKNRLITKADKIIKELEEDPAVFSELFARQRTVFEELDNSITDNMPEIDYER